MQDAANLDRRSDVKAETRLRERLAGASSPEARVTVLAETTDLSPNQAEDLVGRCGDDLDRLASEAFRYREG
jgi:hypothetical protein